MVHQAPAYGEDDYRVCIANGVVKKGDDLPDPVDANGCFCHPVTEQFRGKHVKDADKDLIASIKNMVPSHCILFTCTTASKVFAANVDLTVRVD